MMLIFIFGLSIKYPTLAFPFSFSLGIYNMHEGKMINNRK